MLFTLSLLKISLAVAGMGYPATPEDLKGHASLNCSGTLIRLKRMIDQPAVLLTNGHCAQKKLIEPGTALANVRYDRSPISIYFGGTEPEPVTPNRVLYATMTGSDLALIELEETYRELEIRGARVYELSDSAADSKEETPVQLVAGFQKEKQLCKISHVVIKLMEDEWTYEDAIALADPCPVEGGWFGAPLLDPTTLKIVAILNSTNVKGGLCTIDNPCEVLPGGERLAFRGRAYAQKTIDILGCVDLNGALSFDQPGCKLLKPKSTPVPAPIPPGPIPTPTGKKSSSWPSKTKSPG